MGEAVEGGIWGYSTRIGWEGREDPFCSIWGARVGWCRTGTILSHNLCGRITAGGPKQVQSERALRAGISHYMQVTSYYRSRSEFLRQHG